MATKKQTTETLVPVVVAPKTLVLEGDPESQMAFAIKAANALMKAVQQKPKPVMIRGEQYLEYGDWQTLARFFGATASVAWSKKLLDSKNEFVGYEARAEVLHNGMVISAAEAMCMKEERNWRDRDEFMLRSMAQTRASAKALRNAYGWVAELAGLKSTPAEEMDGVAGYDHGPIKATAVPVVVGADEVEETAPPLPLPTNDKPWQKVTGKQLAEKSVLNSLKADIKELSDRLSRTLLFNKADYVEYIKTTTGLDLNDQTVANLQAVKERLQTI